MDPSSSDVSPAPRPVARNSPAAAAPKMGFRYTPFTVGGYYTDGTVIGEGAFGHVLLGHGPDSKAVALKLIKKGVLEKADDRVRRQIWRELELLTKSAGRPQIVRLFGHYTHPETGSLVMVLEYCDSGDLDKWIAEASKLNPTGLTEENARYFIALLCLALFDFKTLDILHRDLKPTNLLLKRKEEYVGSNSVLPVEQYELKVADLGLSRELDEVAQLAETRCGTGHYMAPEVLEGTAYDFASDIYSMGVILYKLLTGSVLPMLHPTPPELELAFRPLIGKVSRDCIQFLMQLLQRTPSRRITLFDIRFHPWIAAALRKAAAPYDAQALAAQPGPSLPEAASTALQPAPAKGELLALLNTPDPQEIVDVSDLARRLEAKHPALALVLYVHVLHLFKERMPNDGKKRKAPLRIHEAHDKCNTLTYKISADAPPSLPTAGRAIVEACDVLVQGPIVAALKAKQRGETIAPEARPDLKATVELVLRCYEYLSDRILAKDQSIVPKSTSGGSVSDLLASKSLTESDLIQFVDRLRNSHVALKTLTADLV